MTLRTMVGGILALGFWLQAWAHGAVAEVSVYDRTEARRLPVHWHQGRARVGHGRHEHSPARCVDFERASHAPAQVLSLYYDSRANLAARGVLREPVPVAPLPRPFPGFVPDPRG